MDFPAVYADRYAVNQVIGSVHTSTIAYIYNRKHKVVPDPSHNGHCLCLIDTNDLEWGLSGSAKTSILLDGKNSTAYRCEQRFSSSCYSSAVFLAGIS